MRTFIDVFGVSHSFGASSVAVVATDRFLSGWGCASGKTHKQVIICQDYEQAARVASNMRGNGYSYINIRRSGSFPVFGSRYSVSYRLASDCPALLR